MMRWDQRRLFSGSAEVARQCADLRDSGRQADNHFVPTLRNFRSLLARLLT